MAVVGTTGSDDGSSAGALLLVGAAGALVGSAVRQPAVDEARGNAWGWYQRAMRAERSVAHLRLQLSLTENSNRAKQLAIARKDEELLKQSLELFQLRLTARLLDLHGESARQLAVLQGEVTIVRQVLLGDEPEDGEDQTP